MKKSWYYSIGFFCAAVLLCGAYYASYRLGELHSEQKEELSIEADATDSQKFIIGEEDGCILVYEEDGITVYEYTDIPVSVLPEEIQMEIGQGKKVKSKVELYSFLETYSS